MRLQKCTIIVKASDLIQMLSQLEQKNLQWFNMPCYKYLHIQISCCFAYNF